MRKLCVILLFALLFVGGQLVNAQSKPISFLEKNGTVSLQSAVLDSLADTLAVVNHRWDDVVWSRVVYRVIDMRDKQNYQLYFPKTPNDEYKSLFRVILEATFNDTLKAYRKIERDIIPHYTEVIKKDTLISVMREAVLDQTSGNLKDPKDYDLAVFDPVTQQTKVNQSNTNYLSFVENQYKYLTQEVVFFDRHMSRLYSKIIGIAPLMGNNADNVTTFRDGTNKITEQKDVWTYFCNSVLCWFLFDELKPYLAKHYVIPSGNDTQRLTFDEFFTQKLYSSYVLGDSNLNNRMILQSYTDPEKIRKEQQRIETELLNFEQDLWEY